MKWVPLRRLLDPARPLTYGIVQAGEDYPGGVPYIRPTDMDGHNGTGVDRLRTTSPEVAAAYRRSTVLEGDIVVSIGPGYGKTMVVPEELSGANLTQGTARVAPALGVDRDYLRWALRSKSSTEYWDSEVAGATFRALNLGPLGRTPIPLRSLTVQHDIATYLERETARIDELIGKQEQLIATLGERRDAWWSETYAQTARQGAAAPLRRWIDSIVDGPFGSSLTSAHYVDEGARVIRLGNIGINKFKGADVVFVDLDHAVELAAHSAQAGDVVIAGLGDERMPLGRAAVVPEIGPAIVKADCFRVRPKAGVLAEYLAWALSAPQTRQQMRLLARGSTRLRLNTSVVQEVVMWVPTAEQQSQILDRSRAATTKIDALTAKAEQFIALAKERRSALITAAVTGQIDVREAF